MFISCKANWAFIQLGLDDFHRVTNDDRSAYVHGENDNDDMDNMMRIM